MPLRERDPTAFALVRTPWRPYAQQILGNRRNAAGQRPWQASTVQLPPEDRGSEWSTNAWGAAIDTNTARNSYGQDHWEPGGADGAVRRGPTSPPLSESSPARAYRTSGSERTWPVAARTPAATFPARSLGRVTATPINAACSRADNPDVDAKAPLARCDRCPLRQHDFVAGYGPRAVLVSMAAPQALVDPLAAPGLQAAVVP